MWQFHEHREEPPVLRTTNQKPAKALIATRWKFSLEAAAAAHNMLATNVVTNRVFGRAESIKHLSVECDNKSS